MIYRIMMRLGPGLGLHELLIKHWLRFELLQYLLLVLLLLLLDVCLMLPLLEHLLLLNMQLLSLQLLGTERGIGGLHFWGKHKRNAAMRRLGLVLARSIRKRREE